MKTKKFILWMIKAGCAGLVALIILNLLCVYYYNIPVYRFTELHSTEYRWEANCFYSRGTEGFACGVTDANGFNNLKTYEKGDIDVLVMGSSHMEAFNVSPDKTAVAVLNKLFADAGVDMNAYNIGISGHTLLHCINNLPDAIQEFEPTKFVVIETQTISPSSSSLEKAYMQKMTPLKTKSNPMVELLLRLPYVRLVSSQIAKDDNKPKDDVNIDYDRLLNEMIKRAADTCKETGTELIIVYNCELTIDKNGNAEERADKEKLERFRSICDANGVTFVDMYDGFKENYEKTYILPRGFSNTEAGKGHINESGHRVIAEELFSAICNQ